VVALSAKIETEISQLDPADAAAFREVLGIAEPALDRMIRASYHLLGRMDQAIGNYEHAARLGGDAYAYAQLGFAYYAARRYDDALDAYKKALDRDPRSAANNRNIGDVYTRLGRGREARAAYLEAIRIGNGAARQREAQLSAKWRQTSSCSGSTSADRAGACHPARA
jgi:tetratricopeptide (TPR) repeat protein